VESNPAVAVISWPGIDPAQTSDSLRNSRYSSKNVFSFLSFFIIFIIFYHSLSFTPFAHLFAGPDPRTALPAQYPSNPIVLGKVVYLHAPFLVNIPYNFFDKMNIT